MIKNVLHISLFVLLLSCQETFTLDVPEAPPMLVVEGKITDQPGPYTIRLHLSSSFDEPSDSHPVQNALVYLSDDQGNRETLEQVVPGMYQTSTTRGTIGVNYTLEVTHENITYTATSHLGPVGTIDSLVSTFNPESSIKEEGYYVSLYAQKSVEDRVNYYRWRLFKNDSLFNGREFLYVDSDEFGATLEGLEFDYAFDVGNTVKCEMESLTAEAYNYYVQLNSILNNDGIVNKSRYINPPTNFNPPVVGVFQTSAVSSEQVVIEN